MQNGLKSQYKNNKTLSCRRETERRSMLETCINIVMLNKTRLPSKGIQRSEFCKSSQGFLCSVISNVAVSLFHKYPR